MRDGIDPETDGFLCIYAPDGNVEGAINQRGIAAPLRCAAGPLVEGVKMRLHASLVFHAITLASAANLWAADGQLPSRSGSTRSGLCPMCLSKAIPSTLSQR